MSLRTDVTEGLKQLRDGARRGGVALDGEGRCSVPLAAPALGDGKEPMVLTIDVQVASTDEHFTISSLLAGVPAEPAAPFLFALLNRQFYANQTDGMSYALNAERNTLLLVYHWVLPRISPEQFASLFEEFALAVLRQLGEIAGLSRLDPGVKAIPRRR